MPGKVVAKSSLIETETPDVINFADTHSFMVSSKWQPRLLTHRLGAKGPGLFLQERFVSLLPPWHYHAGGAVLRVDGGPSTSAGGCFFIPNVLGGQRAHLALEFPVDSSEPHLPYNWPMGSGHGLEEVK